MWLDFVDQIYLLNLQKRTDRLLESAKILEEYQISYKIFTAIEKSNGAEGLRDSMLLLFREALENNYKNILVFEDDFLPVCEPFWLHDTLDKAVQQLPENYHIFFLGGQPSAGFSSRYSANLFPAIKYFSTHSVIYSQQGIKEIMGRELGYPIDNWLVDNIEIIGHCYAVNPLLCTQRSGYSDIGKNEINWDLFITPAYKRKISELDNRI